MRDLRRPRLWLALWWLAIGICVAVSLLPPVPAQMLAAGGDKLVHLLCYGLLAFAAVQLFETRRALLRAAFGLAALGLGLEFAQELLIDWRRFEWADALANVFGVALGSLAAFTPAALLLQRLEAKLFG